MSNDKQREVTNAGPGETWIIIGMLAAAAGGVIWFFSWVVSLFTQTGH